LLFLTRSLLSGDAYDFWYDHASTFEFHYVTFSYVQLSYYVEVVKCGSAYSSSVQTTGSSIATGVMMPVLPT